LKWHDQGAIWPPEGNLFEYHRIGETFIIIDNNGYSHIKISDDPARHREAVETVVAEIILGELKKQDIGISFFNRRVTFPFLYPYLGEDTFFIRLADQFYERGINLLFSSVRDRSVTIGLIIEENNFHFYSFTELEGDGDIIFCEITNSQNWIWSERENRIYSVQVNRI